MDDNLKQQYADIADFVKSYQAYSTGILKKIIFKLIKEFFLSKGWGLIWRVFIWPWLLIDVIELFVSLYPLSKGIDLLSDKSPDIYKRWINDVADSEDRKHIFFGILTSDYYIDALSRAIEMKFAGYEFAKLNKLHEIKTKQLSQSELKQITGVLLALLAFLLKSVPEELIGWLSSHVTFPLIGWKIDYTGFKIWSFIAVAACIVYVALGLLPVWLKQSEARRHVDPIGEVLKYTEIRLSK
ncbi:MAG: hypothetical protein JST85_01920 [Acidobacteria bacterium]|nr:hypothetical protein [Acidobacteriota bacterium]